MKCKVRAIPNLFEYCRTAAFIMQIKCKPNAGLKACFQAMQRCSFYSLAKACK